MVLGPSIVRLQLVTVGYGHSSDKGNGGKVGKVSNVGAVGHSSDKGS